VRDKQPQPDLGDEDHKDRAVGRAQPVVPILHQPRTGFQAEDRTAFAEGAVHTEGHLGRRCNLTHALPVQVEQAIARVGAVVEFLQELADLGSFDRPEQCVADRDACALSPRGMGQWRSIP